MEYRREIKFRGFATHAKKWVYGLLMKHVGKTSIIIDESGVLWPCYASSIGQFIGAKALGENNGWHWTAIMKDGTIKTFSKDHENITAFGWMKKNGVSSMQPTNDGPDLYEGDIVSAKFTNGKRDSKKKLYTERVNCLVVFDHANLEWRLQRLQAGRGYGGSYGSQLGWDIKLVGNSTEHPHLLNDKASKGKRIGALNQLGKLVGAVG